MVIKNVLAMPRTQRLARMIARPCGAALLGAVVGIAIVTVWTQTLVAQRHSCHQYDAVCIGPDLAGIAAGVLVVVIISAIGLAVLRVEPLLAVPVTLVLTVLITTALDRVIPGGGPPPAWLIAALMAAGYATVCLAVTSSGRARQAGLVLLVIMIVAAMVIPHAIH